MPVRPARPPAAPVVLPPNIMNSFRAVVITGQGWLLPPGVELRQFHPQAAAPEEFAPQRLRDFAAGDYVRDPKVLRAMNRLFQIAAAAGVLAMHDAGFQQARDLTSAGHDPARCGTAVAMSEISPLTQNLLDAVIAASPDGRFDLAAFGEIARHQLHPFRRLTMLPNMAAAHISLLFGLQGPSYTLDSGITAGMQAILEAYWAIADHKADLMVCEAADSPENALRKAATLEVAGALVLEAETSAQARQVRILARVRAQPEYPSANTAARSSAAPAAGSLLAVLAGLRDLSLDQPQSLPGLELFPPAPPAEIVPRQSSREGRI